MKKIITLLLLIIIPAAAQPPVRIVNPDGSQTVGQNFNSGIVTLTNSAAALTALTTKVKILHCANTTGGAITLTITDTAGNSYWPAVSMAANSVLVANYGDPGLIMVGIKWNASANSSINCQLEGLQ